MSLFLEAFVAGDAAVDGLAGEAEQLGFPAGPGQGRQGVGQQDFRVAALARAAVDGQCVHGSLLSVRVLTSVPPSLCFQSFLASTVKNDRYYQKV
jgi:hypothetical protein